MRASRPSSSTDSGSSTSGSNPPNRSGQNSRSRPLKRSHSTLLDGNQETWAQLKAGELLCPICFDDFTEPQVTKCGHTYCNSCITKQILLRPACPECSARLTKDDLSPSFMISELVNVKKKAGKLDGKTASVPNGDLRDLVVSNVNRFDLNDIDLLMTILRRKKDTLLTESEEKRRALVISFLNEMQRVKLSEKQTLERELELIHQDLQYVSSSTTSSLSRIHGASNDDSSTPVLDSSSASDDGVGTGFNTQKLNSVDTEQSSLPSMKRRIGVHFEELQQIYLDSRNAQLFDSRLNDAQVPSEDLVSYESLDIFGETLSRISRYHRLKPLATLSYSADQLSNSNIVSSIEFDKDCEFFAIAGVTRKIKLFEYATVIGSAVDIHCPNAELTCTAKISCVAWSSYFKNYLASSDYDGCVTLWDAATASKTRTFSEHEKRVWSVDWSNGDPKLMASGSDDSKVRLWATNSERSIGNLEAKANVCCVKFCPKNTFHIAFGSADHCVHYYDFRHTREPLGVLQGHKKAVSYVKFASKDELVSASTDSQLKLWNLEEMNVVRSFKGHTNEKNFVGLATDGNYIACGSENNSVYVYYKALPKPLFSFKFDNHRSMIDRPRNDETTEFVSAVAWKKGSPVVVAANSQGAIKILELV